MSDLLGVPFGDADVSDLLGAPSVGGTIFGSLVLLLRASPCFGSLGCSFGGRVNVKDLLDASCVNDCLRLAMHSVEIPA